MLAERAPSAGQVLLDHLERKRVVAGGHRRVRREHGRPAHFLERAIERAALVDELADALEDDEAGVAFVQVVDRRVQPQGAQDADAADAEDDLLLDTRLAVAAVESRGELPVPRRVLLEIGVEQEQLRASELHAPHRDENGPIAERHGHDAR